jgi:hypothetical protein
MQMSIEQLSSLSEEEIRRYIFGTIHPYKCEWNGCHALLNCWATLKKVRSHFGHGGRAYAPANASLAL